MMRFSDLRNAVLAFMLVFTAACTSGGDTANNNVGNQPGDTSDATVADCCEVDPLNAQTTDTTVSPPAPTLVPFNSPSGTVSLNGRVSGQIGQNIDTTDVSRIMVLMDTDPGTPPVTYEHIVADSGHMFDDTDSQLTSDPDATEFATVTDTVATPGPQTVVIPGGFTPGTLRLGIYNSAGALVAHCAPSVAFAGAEDCQDASGAGPGAEVTIAPNGADVDLTYISGAVSNNDTIRVTYRDGSAVMPAIDDLGNSGNNGLVDSITGPDTAFRGDLASSGAVLAANTCRENPGTAVDDADLTGNIAGLNAALGLDDGGGSIVGATWGIDDAAGSGVLYPCAGFVATPGGGDRQFSISTPIPVNVTTTASIKVIFLDSNDELLGQTALQPAGTSTTVVADNTDPLAVAGSPFASNLFVSSDTTAPTVTSGDLVPGGTGVLTTGLSLRPLPIDAISWFESNNDLAVSPLSSGLTVATRNLRASNVQQGDVVTITEGANLGAVFSLGALDGGAAMMPGPDDADVSPSRHSLTDPIINGASGVNYELFHTSTTVSRERESSVAGGPGDCAVSPNFDGADNRCVSDGGFNIVRSDGVSVQGRVSDGAGGSNISTLRVTGTSVSGEEVEQVGVISRDRTKATHEYLIDTTNNLLLTRREAGDDTTNDCYEVVDTGTPGAQAVSLDTGNCASLSGGDVVTVDLSGVTITAAALTDNTDTAPPHLDGNTAEIVNAINIGRPASEQLVTDGAGATLRLTTVRRGSDAADTSVEFVDNLGTAAGDESDPELGEYGVSVTESGTNIDVVIELPNIVVDPTDDCATAGNCPIAATVQGIVDTINGDVQAGRHVFAQVLTDTNTLVEVGTAETEFPSLLTATETLGTDPGGAFTLPATAPPGTQLNNVPDFSQFGASVLIGGSVICRDGEAGPAPDGSFDDDCPGIFGAGSDYNGGGGSDEVTLNVTGGTPGAGESVQITYFYDNPNPGPFVLQTDFYPVAPDGAAAQTIGDAIAITNNNGGEVCDDPPTGVPPTRDGILECTGTGSGIIDYDTGEITVTFGSNVDVANGVNIEYAHTGAVQVGGPSVIGVGDATEVAMTLYPAEPSVVADPMSATRVRAALFNGEDGGTAAAITGAEIDFDGGQDCGVSATGCPAVTPGAPGRLVSSNPKIQVGVFDSVNGVCLPSIANPAGQSNHPDICFSAQIGLTEGTTSYTVTATDAASNSAAPLAWPDSVSRDTTPAFMDTDAGATPSAASDINNAVCEAGEFDAMPICVSPADVNLAGQIETFATTVDIGGKVRDFQAGTTVFDATNTFPVGDSGRVYVRVTTDTPISDGGPNYDSFATGGTTDNLGNPIPYVDGDPGADQGSFQYSGIPLRVGGVTNVKITLWDQTGNITEFSTQITQISTATTTPPSISVDCFVEDLPRAGGAVVPCPEDTDSVNPNTPANVRLGKFGSPAESAPLFEWQPVEDFVVYTNSGVTLAGPATATAGNTFCNTSFVGCGGAAEIADPVAGAAVLLDSFATARLFDGGGDIEICIDDGNGTGTAGDGSFDANAECRDASGATTTGSGTVTGGVFGTDIVTVTFETAADGVDDQVDFTYTRDTELQPVAAGELNATGVADLDDVAALVGADIYLDGSFLVDTVGLVGGEETCTDAAAVVVAASPFEGAANCATGNVTYTSGAESITMPDFAASLARDGRFRVSFSAASPRPQLNNNFNTSVPIQNVGSFFGGVPLLDNTQIAPLDDNTYVVLGVDTAGANTTITGLIPGTPPVPGAVVTGVIPGAPIAPGSVEIVVTDAALAPQQIICDNGIGGWANATNRPDCNAAVLAGNDISPDCSPLGTGADTCVIDYTTGAFQIELAAATGANDLIVLNAANSSRFGVNFTPPTDLRVVSSDRVSFSGRALSLNNAVPDIFINETPFLTASTLPAHGALPAVAPYSLGFFNVDVVSGGNGTNEIEIGVQMFGTVPIGLPIDNPATQRDEAIRVGDYLALASSDATVASNEGLYRITAISDDPTGGTGDADGNCQNTLDTDGDGLINADSDPCVRIFLDRELPTEITNNMKVSAERLWRTQNSLALEDEGINSFIFLAQDNPFENRRATAFTILRDLQPPSIVIQGVIDGTAARTVTPKVFVTDASLFFGGVHPTPDALRPTPSDPSDPATYIAVSRLDANGFDEQDDPYETGYAVFGTDLTAAALMLPAANPTVPFDISNDTGNNDRFGVPRGDGASGGVTDWPALVDLNAGATAAPTLTASTVLGTARGKGSTDAAAEGDTLDGDRSCLNTTACPSGQPMSYQILVQASDRGGLDSMASAQVDVVQSTVNAMLEGAMGLVSGNPALVRLLSDTTNLRTLTLDQISLSGVLYNLNLGTAQLLGSPSEDAADNPQAFFYINNGARDSFGLLLGTILEDPDGDPTSGDDATAVTLSNVVRILADNGVLDDLLPIINNRNILNPQADLIPGSSMPASERKGDMSRSQTFLRNLLVDTDASFVSTCGFDQQDLDSSGMVISGPSQECFSQEGIIKEAFPAIQATLDFGRVDDFQDAGSSPRVRDMATGTDLSARISGSQLNLQVAAGFAQDDGMPNATALTAASFLPIDATDAGGANTCLELVNMGLPLDSTTDGDVCRSPVNVQPGDILVISDADCQAARRIANYADADAGTPLRNRVELAEAFPQACINACDGDCEYQITAPNGPALNPILELVDLLAFGVPGNNYDVAEDGTADTLGGENELLGALFHLLEGGLANDPTFFDSNGLVGMADRSLVCPQSSGLDGGAACSSATPQSQIDDAESLQAMLDLLTELFDDDVAENGQEFMTRFLNVLQALLLDSTDSQAFAPEVASAQGTTVLESLIPLTVNLLDDGQDRLANGLAVNDIGGLLTAPATSATSPLGVGALDGAGAPPGTQPLDARRNTRLNLLLRSTWWLAAPLCATQDTVAPDIFPNGSGACGLETHVDLNGDGMGADGTSQRVSLANEEIGEYTTDRILVAVLPLLREIVDDPDNNPRGLLLPGSPGNPDPTYLTPSEATPLRSIAERLLPPVDLLLNDPRLTDLLNDFGALLDPGTGISDLTAFDKQGPVGLSVLTSGVGIAGVAGGVGPYTGSDLGDTVARNGLARVYSSDTNVADECTDVNGDGAFGGALSVDDTTTTPCNITGMIDYSDGTLTGITFTNAVAAASDVLLDYGPAVDANPFIANPPLLRIISQISSEELDVNVTPGDLTDDEPATESLTEILNILLEPIGPDLAQPQTQDINVDNDGNTVDTDVANEGFFAGRTPVEILLDVAAQMLDPIEKDPKDYDVTDRTLPDHDGLGTDVDRNRTLLRVILDGLFDDPNVDDPSLNDHIDDYPGNPCAGHGYDDADAGDYGTPLEPTCTATGGLNPSGTRGPLGGDNIAVPQRTLDILPELLNTMARFGFDETNTAAGEPLTSIFENCDDNVAVACPANDGYPDDVTAGNQRLLSNARIGIDIALQLDQPLQVGAGNSCDDGLLCFDESLLREAIESISNLTNAEAVDSLLQLLAKIEEDITPINGSTSIPNPDDVARAAGAVRALADPDGDGDSAPDGVLGDLIPIVQVIPASGQTQQIIDLLRAIRGAGYSDPGGGDPAIDIRGGELLKAQEDVLLSMLDAYSGATNELMSDDGTAFCPDGGEIGATGGILDSKPAGLNTPSDKGVLVGGDNGVWEMTDTFSDESKDFAALGVGAGAHLCIETSRDPFTERCALVAAQPAPGVGMPITFTNMSINGFDLDTEINSGANACVASLTGQMEVFPVGVGEGGLGPFNIPLTLPANAEGVILGSVQVDWDDGGGPRDAAQDSNGDFTMGTNPGDIDANTAIDYINGDVQLLFTANGPADSTNITITYDVALADRCSYRIRMMREPYNGCRGGAEIASYDPDGGGAATGNPGLGKSLSTFRTGTVNAGIPAGEVNTFTAGGVDVARDSRLDLLLRAVDNLADGDVNGLDDFETVESDPALIVGAANAVDDYSLAFRLERILDSVVKDDPDSGFQSIAKTLLFGTGSDDSEEGPIQSLLNDDGARASLTATLALFGRMTTLPVDPASNTVIANSESAFDQFPPFQTVASAGWPEVSAAPPCTATGTECDGNAIHDAVDYQFLALSGLLNVLGDADGLDDDDCNIFGPSANPPSVPNPDSGDTILDGHCDDPDVLYQIVSSFIQADLVADLLPGIQIVLEATNATGNEPPLGHPTVANQCASTPGNNMSGNVGFFTGAGGCSQSDFNFRDLRTNRIRGHQTQIDRDALADIIMRTVFSGNGDYVIYDCLDNGVCGDSPLDPAAATEYPEAFAPIDVPSAFSAVTDGVLEGSNQVLVRGIYQSMLEYLGEDTSANGLQIDGGSGSAEIDDQFGYGTRRNRFVALEELLDRLVSSGELSQALRIVRGIAIDKANDETSDARDLSAPLLPGEVGDDPTMTDPEGHTQRDIGPILAVQAGLGSRGTISSGNPYQSALDVVGDFAFTLLRDPTDCDESTVLIERNVEDTVVPVQPLACPAREAAGFGTVANNSEDTDSVFRDVGVTQERPIQPILNEAVFESLSALFAGDDQAIIVQALPFLGAFLNETLGPVLQRNSGDFLEYDYCDVDMGACAATVDTTADALLADLQKLIPEDDFERLNPLLTDDLNRNGTIGDPVTGFGLSSPVNDLDTACTGLVEADNRVVNCYQGTDETPDMNTANDWGAAGACGAMDVVATPVRCADADPEVNRNIGFVAQDDVVTIAQIEGLDAAFLDGLADLIANENTANAVNNQSNRTSTASEFDTFTFRNVDTTQAVDPNFVELLTALGELLTQTAQ